MPDTTDDGPKAAGNPAPLAERPGLAGLVTMLAIAACVIYAHRDEIRKAIEGRRD